MNIFEKILERLEATNDIAQDDSVAEVVSTRIWNKAIHRAKQIVKEVAEEYNGGWIACSDRLPEAEADVLLSLRSLDVYTGFRANAEGCFYIDGDGYVEYENVIAWKPLPEPYKESEY